jgi:hypothetical protein
MDTKCANKGKIVQSDIETKLQEIDWREIDPEHECYVGHIVE